MSNLIISGAYGRDYPSVKEAKADWEEGKDFQIRSLGQYHGAYCSIRDFGPEDNIELRYSRDRKVTIVQGEDKE